MKVQYRKVEGKGVEKGLRFARNTYGEMEVGVVSLIRTTPALSGLREFGGGASPEGGCVPFPPIAARDVTCLDSLRCLGSQGPMMAEQASGQMQLAPMGKLQSHARSP